MPLSFRRDEAGLHVPHQRPSEDGRFLVLVRLGHDVRDRARVDCPETVMYPKHALDAEGAAELGDPGVGFGVVV
jgi:hypothetical protein